jgi:hypothetical protein
VAGGGGPSVVRAAARPGAPRAAEPPGRAAGPPRAPSRPGAR